MRGVRLQVGAVPILGGLIEVVVLGDEGFELGLDVYVSVSMGFVFV